MVVPCVDGLHHVSSCDQQAGSRLPNAVQVISSHMATAISVPDRSPKKVLLIILGTTRWLQ